MALPVVLSLLTFFLACGWLIRRQGWLGPDHAPRLTGLALNVTVPAGVLLALHQFPLQGPVLLPSAAMAVVTVLSWWLGWAAARGLRVAERQRPVLAAAVAFGNTAYIGFPVVRALYGEAGLAEAVLVDQVGSEPLAFSLGALAAGAAEGRIPWRRELLGMLRFVPLWALAAGLLWSALALPAFPPVMASMLEALSAATVPLVMVAMGLVLRLGRLREVWRTAAVVALLRLVATPLLALGGARLCGLTPLPGKVLVVESAMPTMLFTLVLAARAGLDTELAAALVAATMLLAPLTLAGWVAWLG